MEENDQVIWIGIDHFQYVHRLYADWTLSTDCGASLPRARLRLENLDPNAKEASNRFHHYNTPSLAHLLALVQHARPDFCPTRTALLVLDDVTVLFPPAAAKPAAKTQSTPRSTNAALQSVLLNALSRIAATCNVAVVINSYVSTRLRQIGVALLAATHSSKEWDEQLASRIVLFRDFPPRVVSQSKSRMHGNLLGTLRYAGIIKAHGQSAIENDKLSNVVSFSISDVCTAPPDLV